MEREIVVVRRCQPADGSPAFTESSTFEQATEGLIVERAAEEVLPDTNPLPVSLRIRRWIMEYISTRPAAFRGAAQLCELQIQLFYEPFWFSRYEVETLKRTAPSLGLAFLGAGDLFCLSGMARTKLQLEVGRCARPPYCIPDLKKICLWEERMAALSRFLSEVAAGLRRKNRTG
jgi:hypothetical protein